MNKLNPPAVLQIDGLCFAYPQRELFTGLSASIPSGVTLVSGGDGSGKTTLLQVLAGALPAQKGDLQINNIRLRDQPATYREHIFWVDPRTTAFDHISAADYFKTLPFAYPRFDEKALADLIDGLSLVPHVDKPLYMLSTGSRRKVWLAAALASGATLTLLDEPFAALDKASISFVLACLQDVACHPTRAWVVAAYEPPGQVPLASVIDLGDCHIANDTR